MVDRIKPVMRILITGPMGYVGPGVIRRLRARFPNAELIGFDSGYFAHNLTGAARLARSASGPAAFRRHPRLPA